MPAILLRPNYIYVKQQIGRRNKMNADHEILPCFYVVMDMINYEGSCTAVELMNVWMKLLFVISEA